MKISTEKFGELEYEERAVIHFTEGILGFTKSKRYILINAEEGSPFKWLQSLEESDVTFLVVDPYTFKPNYKFKISRSDREELGVSSDEDYVVFVIIVVNKDPEKSTANLLGPIILNVKNQKAKQIVLSDANYSTRYRLLGK